MNGFKTLSDYFDATINSLFGVGFNDLFSSNLSNTSCYRKVYKDPRGNVAEMVTTDVDDKTKTTYYVNGKVVDSLPKDIIEQMSVENLTPMCNSLGVILPPRLSNKLPDPLVRGTDFPRMDILLTENKEMIVKVFLAGVDPERVGLSFADDYLRVDIAEETKEDSPVKMAYVLKGSKGVDGSYHKEIFIDPTKYDVEGLTYEFKHGVMSIKIPKSQFVKQSFTFKTAAQPKIENKVEDKVEENTEEAKEPKKVKKLLKKKAETTEEPKEE